MERKLTLYELTDDFGKLMEIEEEDEITDALVAIVAGEIERKAENVCKFVKVLEGAAEQFKAEEERIREARKALENKADRVREYVKDALLNAGIDRVSAGTFKIAVGLSPGTVVIDDIDAIPGEFITVVPAQKQADKNAIRAAIKADPASVPGAHIEAGYMLRIR